MSAVNKVCGVVLSAKVLLASVVIATLYGEFNAAQFQDAYANWPPGGKATLSSRFSTWDIAHYLRLSQDGYEAGSQSCAFYPLWPAVIRATTAVFGDRFVLASLLLTNALSLIGLWVFYRLVDRHYGPAMGRDSLILLLAFPAALFFAFPYTESLYFVVLMLFFWGLELERWLWTAVAGFLLPLARPVGVFTVVPLVWYLYGQRRKPTLIPDLECGASASAAVKPVAEWHWLVLLCPLLGYAAYFGLMYAWTGNAFEGFDAQKAYPNSPSIKNMFNFAGFFNALANVHSLDGMTDSALDRGFFLLFLALLPAIWKLNKTWFWYTLLTGLVPALTSYFMSYRRYIMVLFPVFIVLAQLLAKTGQRWIFWYYVVLMAAMQAWAVVRIVNFNWAG